MNNYTELPGISWSFIGLAVLALVFNEPLLAAIMLYGAFLMWVMREE